MRELASERGQLGGRLLCESSPQRDQGQHTGEGSNTRYTAGQLASEREDSSGEERAVGIVARQK
eukprot:556852-Hanusia_phi.AAC.1